MIRTFDLKTSYIPVVKVGKNFHKISWDYEPLKDPIYAELTPEEKEREAQGEIIDRTIIGYKDTDYCIYMYDTLHGNITIEDIKRFIINWYNELTDYKILSSFKWNNKPVYLSTENLFNFKAAYDLAVQTNGLNLPITFKLGEINDEPIYHTFTTVEELADFYTKATAYINQCLNEGWLKKDNIDWSIYEEALNNNNE